MSKLKLINCVIWLLFVSGCNKNADEIRVDPVDSNASSKNVSYSNARATAYAIFAKGSDVSWLTEMESKKVKFYDKNTSVSEDLFEILKRRGISSIRLRVFVNPTDNWCDKNDVVAKAKRAKAAGMRIMIDFHYSDIWADPGKQTKPTAWKSYTLSQLYTAVYNHTRDVLSALKNNGVTPEWVQVGNENNDGMLWPEGKATINMYNYGRLQRSGYNAAKSIFPSVKVVIHIGNSTNKALFTWLLDGLWKNEGKWDVVGISHYPEPTNWKAKNEECLELMKHLKKNYKSEIIICEAGLAVGSPKESKLFLEDLINKNRSVMSGGGGVFYWEPECYGNWKGYKKGAFDTNGRPTEALDAFLW